MSDDNLPQPGSLTRFLGVHPDGHKVDNVTGSNRYAQAPGGPTAVCKLVSEDETSVIAHVEIPNTRERPDVVMYLGVPYLVVTTKEQPFVYREVMWAKGKVKRKD